MWFNLKQLQEGTTYIRDLESFYLNRTIHIASTMAEEALNYDKYAVGNPMMKI